LLSCPALFSQGREEESVRMGLIKVIRPTAFRAAPFSRSKFGVVLRPETKLNWITGSRAKK
jgi:hypothetical protein